MMLDDECCGEFCPYVDRAKADAQAVLDDARAEWEAKRVLMNQLYSGAVRLRAAQNAYFKSRLHEDLVKSRVAEADFDRLLARIRTASRPAQPTLFDRSPQVAEV